MPHAVRLLPRGDAGDDLGVPPSRSSGCGGDDVAYAAGQTVTTELQHDGLTRTFGVHVPAAYDDASAHPLVIVLHGGFGSGLQVELSTGMSDLAEREGFIAVYPDGTAGTSGTRTWNAGGCCGPSVDSGVDDVGFVLAAIDEVAASACVDVRRIYVTGISNGAMLSHRIACDAADRVTAIAPVAGALMADPCEPTRPVPVFAVHGTDDQNVPWDGGVGCGFAGVAFTSVAETIGFWTGYDACDGRRQVVLTEGDGTCETYGTCAAGSEVELCTIQGGGHAWPGGAPRLLVTSECQTAGEGAQSTTFFASEHIWEFFTRFAL